MVGSKNDLSVGKVFVQREGWNRADGVTHGKAGNILAHGIDNTGSIISETRREFYRFDIFVMAPHRLGTVDADCFDLDTNFVRTRSGDLHFDEFEDFRPSGLCELDDARHDSLLKMLGSGCFGGVNCPTAR